MKKFKFEVEPLDAGIRLDKFLTDKLTDVTRSKIQEIIDEKLVLNEQYQPFKNSSYKIKAGERIYITMPEVKPLNLEAKEIAFEIVYEDDDLLVINKPAHLTVHPGAGNQSDTLVNALLFTHKDRLSSVNGEFRPGIVHRLDKDTSGLMLVAKNDFTHQKLSDDLKNRHIKRSYLAFIYGALDPKNGRIDKNIARSRVNRLKMTIVKKGNGRIAITNYETKTIFCAGFVSLVKCNLDTGRTHQIRVHMESVKHSIIGDKTYGSCKKLTPKTLSVNAKNAIEKLGRQALHSFEIAFVHPRSGKEMSFAIELPDDLKHLEECLKKSS